MSGAARVERLRWREALVRFPPLRNAAISGLLVALGVIVGRSGGPREVAAAVFMAAIVIGAWFFAQEGLEELVEEREVGIEVLMLAAAAGAIVFGLFAEAAALVFLYATAEAIEELTFARTRSAIRDLLDLAPRQARIVRDGREQLIAVEQVQPGDRFVVHPGESLPTDGVIRAGRATLNEAAVTGESLPVEKGAGDEVFAGTVNGTTVLEVEATRAFADTTLQRIVHLVEEAQAQKSRAQRFVDRFSDRYSPAVLGAGAAVAVVPPLFGGDWREWALRGVTLLVAGAPCALVMSIPVAVAAAISRGGRDGVLIKGGGQLEALARVRVVCLDKTGTLTRGEPVVTDVLALNADHDALLAAAASVEQRSEHPLATPIVAHARSLGIDPAPADEFEALVGHGARGRVAATTVQIGSPRLFVGNGHEIPADVARLQREGKTVVLVAIGATLAGLIALRDEPRPDAHAAIAALRRAGIERIVMLSGDNQTTAAAIAHELAVDEVKAELLPEQKVAAISELRQRYGAIAMIGDGINDAPALAAADLGIAIGTGGTDAAIEAADIALMADDLNKAADAIRLGRRTATISRQNLAFSIILLAVLIPSAVLGLVTIVAAVAIHEASELLAVANGIRAGRAIESDAAPATQRA